MPDPRAPVLAGAALVAQLQLQQRMVAGLSTTFDAVNYLERLTAALAARAKDAEGKTGAVEIGAAIKAINVVVTTLETGPAGLGPAHRDLGRRLNDQVVGDEQPTPSIVAGVDAPCVASIDAAIVGLRTLQSSTIAPLDALLAKTGLASAARAGAAAERVCREVAAASADVEGSRRLAENPT